MRDRARDYLGDAVLAGMVIGSLGGLVELVLLGVLRFGFGRPLWLGPHVLWMTPLLDAALAVSLMVGVWLVASWRPVVAWRLGVIAGLLVALWGVLLLLPGLHYLATAVLATGVAIRLARGRLGSREWLMPRARFLAPWLGGLILFAAGAAGFGRPLIERLRVGRLPAATGEVPNVLLIIVDTERAQSLSLHGNPRPTSRVLDSLAPQGIVFERAMAPSSWTLPSHASLFTGRYAHELSAGWLSPLDRTYPTLAERLSQAGYATAGFVANTFYCAQEFGLARGFLHYEDFVVSFQELLLSSAVLRKVLNLGTVREMIGFRGILARRSVRDINQGFLRWLDGPGGVRPGGRRGRPYFAFLNYFDVHDPYAPSPQFQRELLGGVWRDFSRANHRLRFAGVPDGRRQRMSDSAQRVELNTYEAAIATVDREIGNLLQALARRGELERTVVIITSDHGEQFGEHQAQAGRGGRLFLHGNSLYSQAIWVPLYLRYPPRLPSGIKVATPVSLRDIPATIGALTGAFDPAVFPGTPLSGLWDTARRALPSSVVSTVIPFDRKKDANGWIASLVTEQYHYVLDGTGAVELFRHPTDPEERLDLAPELQRTPAGMLLIDSLDTMLRQTLKGWGKGR
jgi:arylsulfatase A-like enzyme